jgi:hypothetical protein
LSRVIRAAIGVAVLTFLALDVSGGALGLAKNGMSATVNRANHPVAFWMISALITGFGLQVIYSAVFGSSPEQ